MRARSLDPKCSTLTACANGRKSLELVLAFPPLSLGWSLPSVQLSSQPGLRFVVDVTQQMSFLLVAGGRELALAKVAFPGRPLREAKVGLKAPGRKGYER